MADTPRRIQRKRTKGWRLPANTISVTRPGRWGNPYGIERDALGWWCMIDAEHGTVFATEIGARRHAVTLYCEAILSSPTYVAVAAAELRGRDLACWCSLPAPGEPDICHAAHLLVVVNRPTPDADVDA